MLIPTIANNHEVFQLIFFFMIQIPYGLSTLSEKANLSTICRLAPAFRLLKDGTGLPMVCCFKFPKSCWVNGETETLSSDFY